MNKLQKTLTTAAAACALIAGVGLSVAQTSGNQLPDQNAAPMAGDKAGTTGNVWRDPSKTNAAAGMGTTQAAPQPSMSSTDTTTSTTPSESSTPAPLAPQADRN